MKRLFAIAPFILLAACEGVPPPDRPPRDPIPPTREDTCNAAQYQALVGQDVTALERVLLLGQVRVIRPGQPVTMDFRPERINFRIGETDLIRTISCG